MCYFFCVISNQHPSYIPLFNFIYSWSPNASIQLTQHCGSDACAVAIVAIVDAALIDGQKVERSAQLKGLPPIDFVNEKSRNFQDLTALFHCSNTDFIRTTEERHRLKVEALWTELVARDMIYLSTYDGWYSVVDESFYSPRELVEGR